MELVVVVDNDVVVELDDVELVVDEIVGSVGALVGEFVISAGVGAWDGLAVCGHSSGSPLQQPTGAHDCGHLLQSLVPSLSALVHVWALSHLPSWSENRNWQINSS